MDPFMDLTIEMSLLTQQLRVSQTANEHHRRVTNQVRSQVWRPYASMDYVQNVGTRTPHGTQVITLFNLPKYRDQA